jgi:diguanylate cyclase (GGDEF)-like protein
MTSSGLLLVDDSELNRDMLSRRLRRQGYAVVTRGDGPSALEAVANSTFDLVLLDIEMPGMSGLEVLRRLREHYSATDLPVVMVTANQESEAIVSALGLGANDYITKPIDFAVALARIDAQLARRRLDAARRTTDVLTGLPNRVALLDWSAARSDTHRPASAVCVNLDRFRSVNNGLGRAYGDRLLVEVAARLQAIAPEEALMARLQGDHFACLLHDTRLDAAAAYAVRVIEAIHRPFDLGGQHVTITASVGVACSESGRAPDELLDQADTAVYRAKTLSGDRWELFDPALQSRAASRWQLELELQQALVDRAFDLRYEPIVELATGTVIGLEALVRWQHPVRGEISPAEFIPVAEETRLIVPLGQLVFRRACEQLREWQAAGIAPPPFAVSVNVSAKQLDRPEFVDEVQEVIQEIGVDPHGLKLEMTESVLMENSDHIRLVFDRLHALGLRIALDDFGTGYSSLNYLQHFSLNSLKVDRSFIHALKGPESGEIVRTIIRLGHTLGMDVVAEGIESAQQIEQLRSFGCRYGQGYFFCRPLDAATASAVLRGEHPLGPEREPDGSPAPPASI